MSRLESSRGWRRGATLVEICIVIAIVAMVASLLVVAAHRVQIVSRSAATAADLRDLGAYVFARATAWRGVLPRSRHSGMNFTYPDRRFEIWGHEYFQYVGAPGDYAVAADRVAFIDDRLRSPFDPRTDASEGYGINVYFELRGDDDPDGPPETTDGRQWRRLGSIPAPSNTVLFAETGVPPVSGGATPQPRDHFMAHFWAQLGSDTTHEVRSEPASVSPWFCMLDGHVEQRVFTATFRHGPDGMVETDRWNPATAGVVGSLDP